MMEVNSQSEYPYISFRGTTLPNHSYVDLSLVGGDPISSGNNNTVQCHTDMDTCCRREQGQHRGDWFAPGNDTRLQFSNDAAGCTCFYEDRQAQVVHLRRRNSANEPTGIYRCVIATNAVHDDYGMSVGETVYVGLYASGGGNDCV